MASRSVVAAFFAAALAATMLASPSFAGSSAILVGAGDIASCGGGGDAKTAALIKSIPGTVFTAGDNVYPDGALINYTSCYAPTWGAFRKRTRPVPGNHDYYLTPDAVNYFAYFGAQAGPRGRGYYAYDLAGWRIYALDSELAPTGAAYSNELAWLHADLTKNPHKCVLAIWHRPSFSTGPHGSSPRMAAFFQLLYAHGADVVINGHDHMYERYTPLDANGTPDAANGIREFVVGTGGASLYPFKTDSPLIDVRANSTYGVLKLTLKSGGYSWKFVPTTRGGFTDSGTASCH